MQKPKDRFPTLSPQLSPSLSITEMSVWQFLNGQLMLLLTTLRHIIALSWTIALRDIRLPKWHKQASIPSLCIIQDWCCFPIQGLYASQLILLYLKWLSSQIKNRDRRNFMWFPNRYNILSRAAEMRSWCRYGSREVFQHMNTWKIA